MGVNDPAASPSSAGAPPGDEAPPSGTPGVRLRPSGRGPYVRPNGWLAILFGLAFVAIGTAIALIGFRVIPVAPASVHAPRWLIALVGFLFALPGLAAVLGGIASLFRRSALDARIAQSPDQPWLGDYPWKTEGFRAGGLWPSLRAFLGAAFIFLFLAPFHGWAYHDGSCFLYGIVGLFDLLALGTIAYGLHLFIRFVKFGSSWVRYHKFPYHPGDLVELAWGSDRGIGSFRKLVFTLRQIQERLETRGSDDGQTTTHVRYQQWADRFVIDGPGQHPGGADLPVTFLLPPDARGTELRGNPPRYWELEIHADTPGVDFKETYLIPVYPRGKTNPATP